MVRKSSPRASGSFKNALDGLKLLGDCNPPYLTDKVVLLISTAGGVRGVQAMNTMEFVVRALRGWAVPFVMPIAQAWKAFDEKGIPQDRHLTEQLHALGREVARASSQFLLNNQLRRILRERRPLLRPSMKAKPKPHDCVLETREAGIGCEIFQKVPVLKAMAPTQTEAPFVITQLAVIALFVVLGIFAVKRFHAERVPPGVAFG